MQGKLSRMLSGGYAEMMLETAIALAMAGAVSMSLVSLAAHLNEARAVRLAAAASSAGTVPAAGVVGFNGAASTSSLN